MGGVVARRVGLLGVGVAWSLFSCASRRDLAPFGSNAASADTEASGDPDYSVRRGADPVAGGGANFAGGAGGGSGGGQSTQGASISSVEARAEILLYGDAGNGDRDQRAVGAAMATDHRRLPFDFAVSMGDNQYVSTKGDTFRRIFEIPYAPLIAAGVRFYQTLGNHDLEEDRLAEQLAYAKRVDAEARGIGGFVLPAEDYVIRRPGLTWVVANIATSRGTVNLDAPTRAFLERELCAPTDGWRFLSTHYPFYSTGARGDNATLLADLQPLLDRCRIDGYYAGHEHHGEVHLPWKWMQHAIVGHAREVRQARSRSSRETLRFEGRIGFARLSLAGGKARFAFVDVDARETWSYSFQRKPSAWADAWKVEGGRVLARVAIEGRHAPEAVEVEVGVARSPEDPLARPAAFAFRPMRSDGRDPTSGHDVFATESLPADRGGFACIRYRFPGESRWTYADAATGGWHGNYDGLRSETLLPL